MNEFPVAAVYDNYVKSQPLLGIFDEGEYFNSGMLLIDVEKWREQNISEKVMEYLLKYPERIKFVDQCGLNAVLNGNWMKLPARFNRIFTYLP
jgi:lipopolysaccharide biosynthesis glycosyltransferase